MSDQGKGLEEKLPYDYLGVVIPCVGSYYTVEEKQSAVMQYMTVGNLNRLSQMTGIPQPTLYGWSKSEWWNALLNKLQEQKKPEYNALFQRLVEKSGKVIEKQLDTDNVKAMDAAKIMGIAFDKRQILNNQPTSISASSAKISDLQAEFERFLSAKEVVIDKLD